MPPPRVEALQCQEGDGVGIDQAEFRRVMGHFASGVTVVTTRFEEVNYGMTVSSFTSLSLVPPLVLICIDQTIATHGALQEAGFFAVNILAENGETLSRRFAGRDPDKFSGIAFHSGQTGAPLLDGALATLECRLVQHIPGGDHTIFIGRVCATSIHSGKPLIYYRGGYHELS